MVCWKISDITCIVEIFFFSWLFLLLLVFISSVAVEHTVGIYGLVVILFSVWLVATHEVGVHLLVWVNAVLVWVLLVLIVLLLLVWIYHHWVHLVVVLHWVHLVFLHSWLIVLLLISVLLWDLIIVIITFSVHFSNCLN